MMKLHLHVSHVAILGIHMDTFNRKVIHMDTMGKRLKSERERLGLSQVLFAAAGGSSKPSQVRYEKGERYPDGAYLQRISGIGVDVLYVLTGQKTPVTAGGSGSVLSENGNKPFIVGEHYEEPQVSEADEQRLVEVFLHDVQASAGPGQMARDGAILSGIGFPISWLARHGISASHSTLIYVDGDSMEPTITHGSMVLVDHGRTSLRSNRVYAFREGEALYIKRLEQVGDQIIVLSDNPEHEARLISGADLEQVTILGEVVWSGRDWQ